MECKLCASEWGADRLGVESRRGILAAPASHVLGKERELAIRRTFWITTYTFCFTTSHLVIDLIYNV